MNKLHRFQPCNGFSLIEVMITVAIVAILAAVGIPSYIEHVQTARRAEAMDDLVKLSQAAENHYGINFRYGKNGAQLGIVNAADGAWGTPTIYHSQSPKDGTTKYYNIQVSASTYTYELRAVPIVGGAQEDDRCGTLTLNYLGATSAAEASCWR